MSQTPNDSPGDLRPTVHHGAAQARLPPGTVVAIGNFDGVHRGHQQVLHQARSLAQEVPGEHQVAVMTFDPHPARLFAPELAPPLISPMDRRIDWLGEAGADRVVVQPFDEALAAHSPEGFVQQVLVESLGAGGVVVGYDFTFGKSGQGTTEDLIRLAGQRGVHVAVTPAFYQDGILVSSTKIREFILSGRVYGASLLLGRPYELGGRVVRGAGRGHTIGYPTANVAVEQELIPAFGVYAARVRVGEELVDAAVSIGIVPTFKQDQEITVEAYLLDFCGDLYERRICLEFVRRLRPERRFESAEALVDQIALDVKQVRDILLTL